MKQMIKLAAAGLEPENIERTRNTNATISEHGYWGTHDQLDKIAMDYRMQDEFMSVFCTIPRTVNSAFVSIFSLMESALKATTVSFLASTRMS